MIIKRTITNGKLDTVTECIGGPEDGTLVSNQLNTCRFHKRKPLSCCFMSASDVPPNTTPDCDYVEYVRVSQEKMMLSIPVHTIDYKRL